ncbi:putative ferredoxin reductase [Gordonia namibiensis NBRC 108229]|uniref:Putative ferredoxin reductase n=1 Tax=Gordonia namibiensis NBRC 108229 TaxID=1208314 RepID=K6XM15_9ACTN|nr:FAD/NAD(P)-binding oxidoreductase [Gordonia namibiensis]GAB99864.1 putative ferredoxin reductase [Gordonia namibiensis NBRC 108229]
MSGSGAGVVIVGAGLGGIRVAENLRNNGFADPITLVGAEDHPPYDRPPLSKSVLLGKDDRVDLKPAEFYAESDITLRLGSAVTSVSPADRTVTLASGDTLAYDTLVLATGLDPRPFPGLADAVAGVHMIRTYDDAIALREEIDSASTAVVIGAGFIGCEVAASLTSRGLSVSLVEPAPTPLAVALGEEIGKLVSRLHTDNGVDLRTGVGVAEIAVTDGASGPKVNAVKLADGTELPADLVVVGIGSTPVTGYLDGSGIELAPREAGGGIACDATGHTSAENVYALGDVANWRDDDGTPQRVEHWNHTVDQASVVAHQITGGDAVTAAVSYFWSDQFDVKIQVLGAPRADDTVHIVSDDGKKFVAYYSRDGILTGVVGAGKVGAVMKTRPKLQTPTPIADLL